MKDRKGGNNKFGMRAAFCTLGQCSEILPTLGTCMRLGNGVGLYFLVAYDVVTCRAVEHLGKPLQV